MGLAEVLPRVPNLCAASARPRRGGGGRAGRARHHRQPGLQPPRRPPRPEAAAGAEDHPLCRAVGLGLAAGPRREDGRGRRPCARAPAVRAALHGGGGDDLRLRRPPGRRRAAGDAGRDRRAARRARARARPAAARAAARLAPRRGRRVSRPVFAEATRRLRAAASRARGDRPGGAAGGGAARRPYPPDDAGWPHLLDPRGFSAEAWAARKRAAFARGRCSPRRLGHGQPRARRRRHADGHRLRRERADGLDGAPDGADRHRDPGQPGDRDPRRAGVPVRDCTAERSRRRSRRCSSTPTRRRRSARPASGRWQLLGRGGEPPGLRAARSVLAAISR